VVFETKAVLPIRRQRLLDVRAKFIPKVGRQNFRAFSQKGFANGEADIARPPCAGNDRDFSVQPCHFGFLSLAGGRSEEWLCRWHRQIQDCRSSLCTFFSAAPLSTTVTLPADGRFADELLLDHPA
jgi:hypothetical protein